jgi:hypothetical protein
MRQNTRRKHYKTKKPNQKKNKKKQVEIKPEMSKN